MARDVPITGIVELRAKHSGGLTESRHNVALRTKLERQGVTLGRL